MKIETKFDLREKVVYIFFDGQIGEWHIFKSKSLMVRTVLLTYHNEIEYDLFIGLRVRENDCFQTEKEALLECAERNKKIRM